MTGPMALQIAQTKLSFSHYDLHSLNILVKSCSVDAVFLYVIDENTHICIPTLGHYPVIIDYGFAYHRGIYPQDDITWFLLEKVSNE